MPLNANLNYYIVAKSLAKIGKTTEADPRAWPNYILMFVVACQERMLAGPWNWLIYVKVRGGVGDEGISLKMIKAIS